MRSALWVHGCCFSCAGCLAKEMNAGQYKEMTAEELRDVFLRVSDTEGITISGGEPFLQAEELATMIDGIKAKPRLRGNHLYRILKNELEKKTKNGVQRLLLHADILIDGHYIKGIG